MVRDPIEKLMDYRRAVNIALSGITKRQKEAIKLYYGPGGKTYKDVSKIMGVCNGQGATLVIDGRARARTVLEKHGFDKNILKD